MVNGETLRLYKKKKWNTTGLVIGPLLFVIYINDLLGIIDNSTVKLGHTVAVRAVGAHLL